VRRTTARSGCGAQLGGGRQRACARARLPVSRLREPAAAEAAALPPRYNLLPSRADAMNWQPVPRIEQGGQYASHGDPYAMQSGAAAPQVIGAGLSTEEQHFLSSCTTREYEEMARRKAEHMESAEHIAPQHNYPIPGKTSRYACTPDAATSLWADPDGAVSSASRSARLRGGVLVCKNLNPGAGAAQDTVWADVTALNFRWLLAERPPAAIPPFALFPGLLAARCSLLNDW
jgi:hypothetical protein